MLSVSYNFSKEFKFTIMNMHFFHFKSRYQQQQYDKSENVSCGFKKKKE